MKGDHGGLVTGTATRRYGVADILAVIGCEYRLEGDSAGVWVDHPGLVWSAREHALVWVSAVRHDKQALVNGTRAPVVICGHEVTLEDGAAAKCLIKVSDPPLMFARVAAALFAVARPASFIHPTASIHPEADIDATAWIGPFCDIGRGVVGPRAYLAGHITVHDNVRLGSDVFVKAGARVGGEGFGPRRNEHGAFEAFPHFGGVVVEDRVHIGSNVVIDRGALDDTRIGEGTQINSLVLIGHNVQIGKHVLIGANTGIYGGSQVGDFSSIWNSCTIFDGLRIGSRVVVGAGSLVTKDVRDGAHVRGAPAREIAI